MTTKAPIITAEELEIMELADLKQLATDNGIPFHPSTGAPKLRIAIADYVSKLQEGESLQEEAETDKSDEKPEEAKVDGKVDNSPPIDTNDPSVAQSLMVLARILEKQQNMPPAQIQLANPAKRKELTEEQREYVRKIQKEATKLVRVTITPTDAFRMKWQCDIFGMQNSFWEIRRYIPFNKPWHVERCLADHIKTIMRAIRQEDDDGVVDSRQEAVFVPAFTVTELPPLTQDELKRLELAQRVRDAAHRNETVEVG